MVSKEEVLEHFAPVFPISVKRPDGSEESYSTVDELCSDLEYFDSEENSGEGPTEVCDARGRPVHLVVEHLNLVELALLGDAGTTTVAVE